MLVNNWPTVLAKSATVWLAAINLIVYVADHMNYLDMLPLQPQHKAIIQGVLLALIPIARIIKQNSITAAENSPSTTPTTLFKE